MGGDTPNLSLSLPLHGPKFMNGVLCLPLIINLCLIGRKTQLATVQLVYLQAADITPIRSACTKFIFPSLTLQVSKTRQQGEQTNEPVDGNWATWCGLGEDTGSVSNGWDASGLRAFC